MVEFKKCELSHRKKHVLGIFGLALLLLPALAAAENLPDIVDRVRPSIVGVGTAYRPRHPSPKGGRVVFLGTGFVVADGKHVVTNLHVVPENLDAENGQGLAVFTGRGSDVAARSARVVARDATRDLALLAIHGDALPPLQLNDSESIREGQDVAFTGFPLGMVLGLHPVTHRGVVSSIAPMLSPVSDASGLTASRVKALRQSFDVLQLDATSYPGNSGSPVYSPETGVVLGVLSSTLVRQPGKSVVERPSGISFAIPVGFVKQLILQTTPGR